MSVNSFWEDLNESFPPDFVEQHKGTELERQAKIYFADTRPLASWDELSNMAKFSWLSFADRRAKRDG